MLFFFNQEVPPTLWVGLHPLGWGTQPVNPPTIRMGVNSLCRTTARDRTLGRWEPSLKPSLWVGLHPLGGTLSEPSLWVGLHPLGWGRQLANPPIIRMGVNSLCRTTTRDRTLGRWEPSLKPYRVCYAPSVNANAHYSMYLMT